VKTSRLAAVSAAAILLSGSMASAASPSPAGAPDLGPDHYGAWGVDLTTGDHSVKPGDDFFSYAEGGWYAKAQIPADQSSTGVGWTLRNRAQAQLRQIIESSAAEAKTPTGQKVGALYKSFMDEARVEALGVKPLKADLDKVASVKSLAEFTVLMGKTASGFGKTLFGVGPLPDPRNPTVNILGLGQDGLGLPDRDYYLADNLKDKKAAYRAYIERTFTLIDYAEPSKTADAVLAFETQVAEASWAAAERRDLQKVINPMTLAELQAYAPQVDWAAYFTAAGVTVKTDLIVGEKSAVQKIAALYASTPLATLKAWETFHVVNQASPYLSKRFVDSQFELTHALTGVQTLKPRWKRGVDLVDGSLGEAVGREYAARYFPAEAKAAATDMIKNLKAAMSARIDHLEWMSAETKAQAQKKLAKMDVQVGYPDKWRDYSGLSIDPADLYGNVQRSAAFEWAYANEDLNKPVDHKKWGMTPQTVNAYNGGLENKIVFPAAILQPPFFDLKADPAANYGAAGAVIGHEITHGFDDQGRQIDETGKVRDWWTAEDAKRFQTEAAKFGLQYDAYEPVPGFHINGKLTMGENIADLGGLLAALDAYHASLGGKPAPVLDGLTGDQRFFLAFAQAWQRKVRDDAVKQQLAADPHSPAQFRVIGPTRNVDAWYAAFSVESGKYVLKPQDRVRIW
jgi:putative endopeptidase